MGTENETLKDCYPIDLDNKPLENSLIIKFDDSREGTLKAQRTLLADTITGILWDFIVNFKHTVLYNPEFINENSEEKGSAVDGAYKARDILVSLLADEGVIIDALWQ